MIMLKKILTTLLEKVVRKVVRVVRKVVRILDLVGFQQLWLAEYEGFSRLTVYPTSPA